MLATKVNNAVKLSIEKYISEYNKDHAKAKTLEDGTVIKKGRVSVSSSKSFQRDYPYGAFAASVLGFCNGDGEGFYGLEKSYNDTLAGVNGRTITLRNAYGNAIADLKRPCKFSCPVDAITYDEYGISVIDDKKCIRCGQCIHKCPFGAIGSKTFIVDVINAIKSDRPVYAMVAPAAEGQFGKDITMASWRDAMKEVGFTDMFEVGAGADMYA